MGSRHHAKADGTRVDHRPSPARRPSAPEPSCPPASPPPRAGAPAEGLAREAEALAGAGEEAESPLAHRPARPGPARGVAVPLPVGRLWMAAAVVAVAGAAVGVGCRGQVL